MGNDHIIYCCLLYGLLTINFSDVNYLFHKWYKLVAAVVDISWTESSSDSSYSLLQPGHEHDLHWFTLLQSREVCRSAETFWKSREIQGKSSFDPTLTLTVWHSATETDLQDAAEAVVELVQTQLEVLLPVKHHLPQNLMFLVPRHVPSLSRKFIQYLDILLAH